MDTHTSKVLTTSSAKAMAVGEPFDAARIELFEILFDYLKDYFFVNRANRQVDEESFRLFSFFESYFSNYIEGTEFDVEEAKQIVDSGIPIPRRDEDSHDILGTFRVLSNRAEMSKTPATTDELYALLQSRHTTLLAERPSMQPGVFKTRIFREDYLLSLRKLTRQKDPSAYVNVMSKLQLFSDNLYGTDFDELKEYLRQCNAYEEPSQAKLRVIERIIK